MKNIQKLPFGMLALAIGVGTGVTEQAFGQATTDRRALEEIVVTARKAEESVQDVPVAVSALSDADLKKQAVTNVYDLQAAVPGFFVATNSQGGAPTFAIRAAKSDNGTSDTVTAYVDDVPMASTRAIAKMTYDMASVSVLKGPQGTFFGTSTTGGAVIFRPNKPSDDFEGFLEVGAGNYDHRLVQGMVNLPVSDILQVRFAGEVVRQDGYVDVLGPQDLDPLTQDFSEYDAGGEDYRSGRLSIRLSPSESLTNDLVINYFHEDNNVYQESVTGLRDSYLYPTFLGFSVPVDYAKAGISPIGASDPFRAEIGPFPTWNRAENIDWGNTTKYGINDNFSVTNILGYQRVRMDTSQDNDATIQTGVNGRTADDYTQWTEEFAVDYVSDSGNFRNKTGVFVSNKKRDTGNSYRVLGLPFDLTGFPPAAVGAVNAFLPLALNNYYNREFDSRAIYSQFSYDFTDTLTVTLGGRYTWDEGDYKAQVRTATGAGIGNLPTYGDFFGGACDAGILAYNNGTVSPCQGFQDFKTSEPSYVFTVENRFSDNAMIYGTLRHGYLVGGFNNQVYTADQSGQLFEPEIVDDAEFGIKADWDLAGRPIRTNLAFFTGKYKDQQRVQNGTTATGNSYIAVGNAGSSSFYGWDLDVTYDIADALRLSMAWNHVRATYDRFEAPVNVPGAGQAQFPPFADLEGEQLAQTPEDIFNISATVFWPVATEMGDLSSTLSWYWRDDTTHHDSPTVDCVFAPDGECGTIIADFTEFDKLESYDLVNFTTSWTNVMGSAFDLRLWVKNVFDEEYAVYGSNQMLQFGYAAYYWGKPREYGLNVRYNF